MLKEIARNFLAQRVRKEKLNIRQKKSIEMMTKAMADQLDDIAQRLRFGQSTLVAQDRLKKSSYEIQNLEDSNQEVYLATVLEFFPSRPFPIREDNYKGSSQRVQRRIINRN